MTHQGASVSGTADRSRLPPSLGELVASREVLLAFASRDLKVKYKQTGLGALWALIQPLTFVIIFTFAFRGRANLSTTHPYGAFLLSAFVPWSFLQTAVTFGSGALLSDAMLLRKVYFPRELPILGAVVASTLDLAIAMSALAVIGPLFGVTFSIAWILLPVVAVPLVAIASGVSLALGALNVYYRDVRYAIPFALQAWLFSSPVLYPLTTVGHGWRWLYIVLNPAAGVLDSFSRIIVSGALPDLAVFGIACVTSLATFGLGYAVFRSLEADMADVV
jgi:lipopolysaccharide transport system permease protein